MKEAASPPAEELPEAAWSLLMLEAASPLLDEELLAILKPKLSQNCYGIQSNPHRRRPVGYLPLLAVGRDVLDFQNFVSPRTVSIDVH